MDGGNWNADRDDLQIFNKNILIVVFYYFDLTLK